MSFTFLASPYSHPSAVKRHERWCDAMDASFWCLKKGIAVYAPIVHWHSVHMRHATEFDVRYFWAQNRPLLEKSSAILILCIDGWKASSGVTEERALARDLKIIERFLIPASDGEYSVHDNEPEVPQLAT